MVYHPNMARTNIDLDEELVAIIMRRYAVHTKRDAVGLALRHLAGIPMTITEALDMRGAHAIGSIPADQRP
jgi:Arc/MetJ family transcription regulator